MFLGRTISPEGISPQARKIQNFLNKLRFPKSKKALQRYLGFVNYYRNYFPRLAEKPKAFYILLRTELLINNTSELKETFESVNKAPSNTCELAVKQTIQGKQLVLITDASFKSAGYALMIEDNPDQKIVKAENVCPCGIWLKKFLPCTTQHVHLLKRFFGNYIAILEFAHILWEATKPTIVLTDNKSVTRFFQTKEAIPPTLWNACDYVLQFNFKIAHSAGADFLSRLKLKVKEKICLKIRKDIHKTPIEVTTSSSDIAYGEQFFFTHADDINESEEQTLEGKERSRQNAKQWAANQKSAVLKTSLREFTKIDGKTTSYSMNGIKANARIRVEQDVDLVLKNMKFSPLFLPTRHSIKTPKQLEG